MNQLTATTQEEAEKLQSKLYDLFDSVIAKHPMKNLYVFDCDGLSMFAHFSHEVSGHGSYSIKCSVGKYELSIHTNDSQFIDTVNDLKVDASHSEVQQCYRDKFGFRFEQLLISKL